MDLWWLMDCKKLYGKGTAVLYKPDMPQEQVMLAEACGVTPETCEMPVSFVEYYENIFEKLKERRIFVRYWNKPRISQYLRITIGTPQEMECLYKALSEILTEMGANA